MSQERTYCAALRVYTPKFEEVGDRVERALKHVRQILKVSEEFPTLFSVVLIVPNDYDCGHTYRALLERFGTEKLLEKVALCTPGGHHSCEVLNYGMSVAAVDSSHVLIISGKAMSYLTVPAMRAIDEAFADGAKVAGLAVDELRDTILAGRIQNTFAAWDLEALNAVGNFDSTTGVEEMAPLVRLIRKFGRCIAPLDTGAGKLDIHESETARARHSEVMLTKLDRQLKEVLRVGSGFAEISSGVLPGYPRSI